MIAFSCIWFNTSFLPFCISSFVWNIAFTCSPFGPYPIITQYPLNAGSVWSGVVIVTKCSFVPKTCTVSFPLNFSLSCFVNLSLYSFALVYICGVACLFGSVLSNPTTITIPGL